MVRTLTAIALVIVMPPLALAGNCHQFFVQKQVVAQPVVYYPQVYYQAGRDIEAEALAAKVAKLVTAQLRSELTLPARQSESTPALSQFCAKCHSGANPKHGLTIDGLTAMACHDKLAAIKAVANDKMPVGQKLTPQQKGQLLDELLALPEPERTEP